MKSINGKNIIALLLGAYIAGNPTKIVAAESTHEQQSILPVYDGSSSNVIKNIERPSVTLDVTESDLEQSLDFESRSNGNNLRCEELKITDLPPWTYDTSCLVNRRKKGIPERSVYDNSLALDGDDILVLHGKLKKLRSRTENEQLLRYLVQHYKSIDEWTSYRRLMGQ